LRGHSLPFAGASIRCHDARLLAATSSWPPKNPKRGICYTVKKI